MSKRNFNEIEEKFSELLIESGLNKNAAYCLVYIVSNNKATSKELEFEVRLRQPEVSQAINILHDKNWIKKDLQKKEGKGRPSHIYKLNKPLDGIINELNERNREKVKNIRNNINTLEDIASKF